MKKTAVQLKQAIEYLEEIADGIMENDVHTGMSLRHIACKIAGTFSSNASLIENLDVDEDTKTKIAAFVKDAVKDKVLTKKRKIKS